MDSYAKVHINDLLYKLEAFSDPPAMPYGKRGWVEDDAAFIEMWFAGVRYKEIARRLHRTYFSCTQHRHCLGLSPRKGGRPPE
jgi:hypothetical protein